MKVVCGLAAAAVLGLLVVVAGVLRTPPPPPRPRIAARAEVRVAAPVAVPLAGPCPAIARPPAGGGRIVVGDTLVYAKLIKQVKPVYPPNAMRLQASAPVRLGAVIGKDGKVQKVEVLSGHPLLAAAVVEAVKQWVYRPVCLDGEPAEVYTVIDVRLHP